MNQTVRNVLVSSETTGLNPALPHKHHGDTEPSIYITSQPARVRREAGAEAPGAAGPLTIGSQIDDCSVNVLMRVVVGIGSVNSLDRPGIMEQSSF